MSVKINGIDVLVNVGKTMIFQSKKVEGGSAQL